MPTALRKESPAFLKPRAITELDGIAKKKRFIPLEILMKPPSEWPVRIQLDMKVMESKLITKVPVRIPHDAIKKHISGRVVVELVLDTGGNIKESKVVEGDPVLSAAVMDAVKQWRFAPTALDDDPVEMDLQIPFTFEMH